MRIRCDDGTDLHVVESGQGEAILFAHEFGGDAESWDAQITAFAPHYRCIRYAARGFLPSDVPAAESAYGQDRSTRDVINIADALGLTRFHLVGLSMGSFTSLMVSLMIPDRILSVTLAGCSSGPCGDAAREEYRADLLTELALLEEFEGDGAVKWFAEDSAYRRMPEKEPEKWQRYCDHLRAQSVAGAMRTMRTLHWNRICLADRIAELRTLTVPALLIYGEEDHPLIEPTNKLLADCLPHAQAVALPRTGHLVNIEETETFNRILLAHLRNADGVTA